LRFSKYTAADARALLNQAGQKFCIGPGEVEGILHLEGYLDAARHINKDSGIIEIRFVFAAADDGVYTHLVLLNVLRLWPSDSDIVRFASENFRKDVTFKNIVCDTRELPIFRFANGDTLKSAHKYNDTTWHIKAQSDSIAVQLTVYVGDQNCNAAQSYVAVEYAIPLSRVLWKNAPRLYENDAMPECAPFVSIERFGSMSDHGARLKLKPTSITVTPSNKPPQG
jgi:hypothetical protein